MRPFGTGKNRGSRSFPFPSLTRSRTASQRDSCPSSIRRRSVFPTEPLVHPPAEHARNQSAFREHRLVLFAFLHDVSDNHAETAVDLIYIMITYNESTRLAMPTKLGIIQLYFAPPRSISTPRSRQSLTKQDNSGLIVFSNRICRFRFAASKLLSIRLSRCSNHSRYTVQLPHHEVFESCPYTPFSRNRPPPFYSTVTPRAFRYSRAHAICSSVGIHTGCALSSRPS